MRCPASIAAEEGLPDTTSDYADEGTAAHFLGEQCLSKELNTSEFLGRKIIVLEEGDAGFADEDTGLRGTISNTFAVDADMVEYVQKYVDSVREFVGDGVLLTECRMSLTPITGEEDAYGTSDAVGVLDDELQVHDLKYGQGKVVEAEENEQLMIYALAALEEYGYLGDFKRVRLVIHQPRLHSLKEWDCSVEDLLAFRDIVFDAAQLASSGGCLAMPGEKQCTWCKAKSNCPALDAFVKEAISQDFENLDGVQPVPEDLDLSTLGAKRSAVSLIEMWCKAVCAKTEEHLHRGETVPGWKLVQGKRGHRAWANKEEAEATLKSMRLKQEEMYSFNLISPTVAEKVLKDSPRKWKRVQELIVRPEGSPSVAPESDKRPALVIAPASDDFENLEDDGSSLV